MSTVPSPSQKYWEGVAFVGSVTTLIKPFGSTPLISLLGRYLMGKTWYNCPAGLSIYVHVSQALRSEHMHVMDGWIIYQAIDPFFARPFACG